MREEEEAKKKSFWEFAEREGRSLDGEVERLASAVIDAAIEVHRHMRPGHAERVYENALCIELTLRGIPFERQRHTRLTYKGHDVGEGYVDVLVGGKLVLELKAVEALNDVHKSQTASYLIALNLELGLLINFNVALLKDGIRRVIRSRRG